MDVKIVDLKKTILEDNDADAALLREELRSRGVYYVNLMSSPGAGKTTTILATAKALSGQLKVGVMEADIDSDVDARTVSEAGFSSIQVHTGGMCHLDASMSRQGLAQMGILFGEPDPGDKEKKHAGSENIREKEDPASAPLDLVILENVGNLVCPAEFDAGAHMNAVILSVPEGDDKPLKYPLMFERCQAVIINKIDAMPAFDFDLERASAAILSRNPRARIFPISAATGEGLAEWCGYLMQQVRKG